MTGIRRLGARRALRTSMGQTASLVILTEVRPKCDKTILDGNCHTDSDVAGPDLEARRPTTTSVHWDVADVPERNGARC